MERAGENEVAKESEEILIKKKKRGKREPEPRGKQRGRAGGRRCTKPAMKYSIFNQSPSVPLTRREKDVLGLRIRELIHTKPAPGTQTGPDTQA